MTSIAISIKVIIKAVILPYVKMYVKVSSIYRKADKVMFGNNETAELACQALDNASMISVGAM